MMQSCALFHPPFTGESTPEMAPALAAVNSLYKFGFISNELIKVELPP